MADTTQTQASTPVSTPINQENWTKKPFFWGGQEVFDNLEKFERISNPTGENQDFDFDFTDMVPEPPQEKPNFQLEDSEVALETDSGDEGLAPLENIGLENIFQPSEETQEETPTFEIEYPEFNAQEAENSASEPESSVQEESVLEEKNEKEIQLPQGEEEIEEKTELPELEALEDWESEAPAQEEPEILEEAPEEEFQLPELEEEKPFTWAQAQNQATFDFPASREENEELSSDAETKEEPETPELTAEEQAHLKMESEPKSDFSPLIEQFNALLEQSTSILQLENKIQKADLSEFEIIGNNTEKSMITYQISQELENDLPKLILKKREKDFVRDEEQEHILSLSTLEKDKNLIVAIDDCQLYEEEKDLQDPVKQLQVWDKLKKFSFLFSERLSELQEQWEAIKEEKEKMKAFRSIFRNF